MIRKEISESCDNVHNVCVSYIHGGLPLTTVAASCHDFCFCNDLQAPRTSRASLMKGRTHANTVAQQALIAHWQSIVKSLNNYLQMMQANYVRFIFSLY